jgi:16S rRNA (guanine527-N7)-methyltransferase
METAIESLRPSLRRAAAELSLDIPEPGIETLMGYLSLLTRWNAHYNLTAIRDPAQMVWQHLADCLAVVAPLRRVLGPRAARLLDVGSGGGLPGIVIAALNPGIDVTCVDSVGKKAAFVQQVAGELQLGNLHARHSRVEQLTDASFEIVTSRAFASLADFTALTRPLVSPDGVWMALKGKLPRDELRQLPASIDVFHVEPLRIPGLNAERCIVWMRAKAE